MRKPKVELAGLRIRGYRSCKNTSLSIDPEITALIGKNGSGKTNVLHGIQLLRRPARIRARRMDKDSLAISCVIEAQFRVYKKIVRLRSKVTIRQSETNSLEEIVASNERWDLREFGVPRRWISVTTGFLRTLREKQGYIVRELSGPMIESVKKGGAVTYERPSKVVSTAILSIQQFRQQFRYYSASQFTNPFLCPTSFEIDEEGDLRESPLSRDGAHVTFLYDLYSLSQRDPVLYSNYTSLVGTRGVHLIDKFAWKKANVSTRTAEVRSGGRVVKKRRERTLIIPTVHIGGDQLSFNQLSEGTFRTLAMLFYIMTDNSKFLLLEEPELCVHHGLLTSVVEILKQFSKRKQVVLSTHSEFVLDSVRPEQVRLVSKTKEKGTTTKAITQALSRKDFAALRDYLRDAGSLGEYWTHSGFGQ